MSPLLEIAVLAHRSGPDDALLRTVAMTAGLQVIQDSSDMEDVVSNPQQRALTM